MKEVLILIPSRLAAQRLPNKPLLKIGNDPMIIHVARQAEKAKLGPVYVATPDQEIYDLVTKAGFKAVMTSYDHQSGSDRIYEAATKIDPQKKYDFVMNLQGDLPLIESDSLKKVVAVLEESGADISTIASEILDKSELENPNNVKAAIDFTDGQGKDSTGGRALYFSRNTVPHGADTYYHHIGVYVYRRKALETFVTLPKSYLETVERLEQLRAMSHGMSIHVGLVPQIPLGVDTQHDLDQVRHFYEKQLAHA